MSWALARQRLIRDQSRGNRTGPSDGDITTPAAPLRNGRLLRLNEPNANYTTAASYDVALSTVLKS